MSDGIPKKDDGNALLFYYSDRLGLPVLAVVFFLMECTAILMFCFGLVLFNDLSGSVNNRVAGSLFVAVSLFGCFAGIRKIVDWALGNFSFLNVDCKSVHWNTPHTCFSVDVEMLSEVNIHSTDIISELTLIMKNGKRISVPYSCLGDLFRFGRILKRRFPSLRVVFNHLPLESG